jgi:hypothetical protein
VFDLGELQLVGCKIQDSLQDSKGLLSLQKLDTQEVIHLLDEARNLLSESCLSIMNLVLQ